MIPGATPAAGATQVIQVVTVDSVGYFLHGSNGCESRGRPGVCPLARLSPLSREWPRSQHCGFGGGGNFQQPVVYQHTVTLLDGLFFGRASQ